MATKTWQNGGVNNLYSTAGNWAEGSKPAAGDNVVISANYNMTLDEDTAQLESWDMTGYPATITWNGSLAVKATSGTKALVLAGTLSSWTSGKQIWARAAAGTTLNITPNSAWTIEGSFTVNDAGNSGTVYMLAGITMGATRTFTYTQGTLHMDGAADVSGLTHSIGLLSSTTGNTRVLYLGASTINMTATVGNVWYVQATGMTLYAGTSTINFTATVSSTSYAVQMIGGTGLTYYNVYFSGAGIHEVTNSITCTNLQKIGGSTLYEMLKVDANIAITGTLTLTGGSSTSRMLIYSSTMGTARTLTAANVSCAYVDMRDITGAGAGSWDLSAITGESGDCGGNSGITFTTAATQTLTGSADVNWSAGTWTSRMPLPQDTTIISLDATKKVTVNVGRLGKNISFTTACIFTLGVSTVSYGSVNLTNVSSVSGNNTWQLDVRANASITSSGKSFSNSLDINYASSPTLTLADSLTLAGGQLAFRNAGTFTTNGYNVTAPLIYFESASQVLNFSNSTLTCTSSMSGSNQTFRVLSSSATVNAGSSTIVFSNTSSSNKAFKSSGKEFYNMIIVGGGSGLVNFEDSCTFNTITVNAPKTVTIGSGQTITVKNIFAKGDSSNLVTIGAYIGATVVPILAKSGSGVIFMDYVSIQGVNVTPANAWCYGNNSVGGYCFSGAGRSSGGNYADAPDTETVNRVYGITNGYSTEGWIAFRSTSVSTVGRVWNKSATSNHSTLTTGTNKIRSLIDFDTTDANSQSGSTSVNTLLHFVAVYDNSDKKVYIYINGAISTDGTQTAGVGSILSDSANAFRIGNEGGRAAEIDGVIYVLRIYRDVVLSQADVTTLYNGGVMTKNSNPLGTATSEYLFKEGSGATLEDTVGGADAAITGSDYWANTGWVSGRSIMQSESMIQPLQPYKLEPKLLRI